MISMVATHANFPTVTQRIIPSPALERRFTLDKEIPKKILLGVIEENINAENMKRSFSLSK